MRLLLFANGMFQDGAMVRRHARALPPPRIVCADGGALLAEALGFFPETIIGDFDSLTAAQVARFTAAGAEIIRHPPEKDETDLELALEFALRLQPASITILGALGARIDQTLANIQLLCLPALGELPALLVDGAQSLQLLRPGSYRIAGRAGDTISLLPLTGAATGIRTRGLRYALRDESLTLGPARGISNVMLAGTAEVALAEGLLLLAHTVGRA